MSLIIPNINLMRNFQGLKVKSGESGKLRSNFAPTNDKMVIIQKGELIQGELTKATVGSSSGGLNHIIWKESGAQAAKEFLTSAQNVVNCWLAENGFTVGVEDTMAA